MDSWLLVHQNLLRASIFLALLALFAALEFIAPRRVPIRNRYARWGANLVLILLGTVLVRVLIPFTVVGVATMHGRVDGLLDLLDLPGFVSMAVAVLLLDLAIYWQHRAFHAVPWLWRLHRLHHTDVDYDVTTGVRFHPLEILVSTLIKIAVIVLLGAPALAVVVFELSLSATSLFNHSNISLPVALDRWLRLFVVTPDMHRVHHSVIRPETNSNFGFSFPWWDRFFATYRAQPARGHRDMTIGLSEFRASEEMRLDRLLSQPFRSPLSR